MINAQDKVEKCITFALAHLFAFATAKLFPFFIKLSRLRLPPLHLLPAGQLFDIKGSELGSAAGQ